MRAKRSGVYGDTRLRSHAITLWVVWVASPPGMYSVRERAVGRSCS